MTAPTLATPPSPARPGSAELCALAELEPAARALLGGGDRPPREFIAILQQEGLFSAAVRILAYALPRRESVWWAWVCARKSSRDEPAPPLKAALDATERWIVQPTEEHRRQAHRLGEEAGFGTAAGCAALAAFLSAGSLAPPDAPVVPPGPLMSAKAVAGSVVLAAVAVEPERAEEKFREFIRLGLEVADRTKLWAVP